MAERGYDERMGARPLSRVIQEYVKKPLADEVLFGQLQNGGTVTVAVIGEGDEARLELVAAPPAPARPKAITGPKARKAIAKGSATTAEGKTTTAAKPRAPRKRPTKATETKE